MFQRLDRCVRVTLLSLLAFAALALASTWDGASVSSAPAQTVTSERIDELNTLRELPRATWTASYRTLRKDSTYNWVDWSQDGCSSPWYVPSIYDDFQYGCLRHDMMWRTLPVADAGTGRSRKPLGRPGECPRSPHDRPVSPHTPQHSPAGHWLAGGMPSNVVRQCLGQKAIRPTGGRRADGSPSRELTGGSVRATLGRTPAPRC